MILSASVWEGRDSVCIHILPNTLNCSCLPGKRLVRLSLTQNYLWNAFLHCTIFSIPEAPFHSKNPFPLTLKLVFRPLLWERGDCSEWNGVFSRKRLSGLSCPRRANILVCRHHTSPYHSAIAQLLYKMPMISLILFFFLHVFPVERINLGMCFQRRFGAVNPWKCFPQDTSRFIAGIHDGIPRTLWELVLVGFPFWGSYGVWGNGYGLGTHQRLGKWVLNLTIQISQPRTEALSSPHRGLSGLSLAFSFSKPF